MSSPLRRMEAAPAFAVGPRRAFNPGTAVFEAREVLPWRAYNGPAWLRKALRRLAPHVNVFVTKAGCRR